MGVLLALAIFIICNCAGYLIFSAIGPFQTQNSPGHSSPNQAVIAYVTPTPTIAGAPATTISIMPLPLLPTITPSPTSLTLPAPAGQPADSVNSIATTERLTADSLSPPLQILSHHSYVDALGWYHIVGEVQNNSNAPMEFVEVIAKLYDDANIVIGAKLTFTAPDVIFPGGRAPFDLITLRRSQWDKIKTYKLEVTGDVSRELLQQHLVLVNQNSHIEDGFLYVSGEVENTGATPTLVKLIITLYDSNRNVVNTNWGYAANGIIAPNQTSTFQVKIEHQTDPRNFHYNIQIEEEVVETN
jgi:hypothetical protein